MIFFAFFQIFEDGASYRGHMKTLAHEVFKFHYKSALTSDIDDGHNSDQRDQIISDKIKRLTNESLFIQGPLDAQVNPLFFFCNPLMLRENRAVLKTLDMQQLSISSNGFTITGSRIVFLSFFRILSLPVRKPVSQWLAHL